MKERIRVYHKDGSLLKDREGNAVELSAVEMTDGWMEDCFVQTTIESAYPISFSIGDYIVYRGERYELNYDPGKAKTARAGSDRGAFRYENVKLNALQDELVRAQFLDVVLGMENTEEQTIPYTALPKFGFYVQTVDDLLDRIQANMDEQMGAGLWALYSRNKERSLQRGCDGAVWEEMYGEGTTDTIIDSAALTIDNQNCWNALALVNSKWDINFVVRGRNVFVDTTGLEVPYEFVYGKRRGLYEITQTADDSQAVTTRLRAYGSEKNLPTHYYANLCVDVFGETSKISHLVSSTEAVLHITIPSLSWAAAGSYFTSVRDGSTAESREYNVTVKSGNIEGRGCAVSSARKEGEGTVTIILNSLNDEYGMTVKNVEDFYTAVMKERKVYFLQGVNKQSFPPGNMTANTDQMPSHMAVTRLMLPGFPKMSVKEWWDTQATEEEKAWINPSGKEHLLSELKNRPYVDSVNIKELGVRNGSVMFDTENKKEGIIEIYPTIEEMTVDGQRIDEINSGSAIKDNGIFKDSQTVPPFSVTLSPKINFDINMLKKEDFTISMKDGKCGGREFKVNGSVKENGVWKLTLDRVKDDALELYFPNKDFQIESGDHFVLTGIEMPDSYVEAASAKLLKYALAWLDKNDYTRYVFEPKVDEIFMAYQHDKAKADTTGKTASLYETLKAGSLLHFSDTDLKIDKSGVIERLIIREELGSIPTYDVTIKEDKDVGALQKMQDAIDTVTMSVKSGLSSVQIEDLIRSRGAKYFLSKTDPDTAEGLIRFLKGIAFGAGSADNTLGITADGIATFQKTALYELVSRVFEAGVGGTGFRLGNYGNTEDSYLEVDRLLVRKAAEFVQLIIRELRHVGGEIVLTPASMKCTSVKLYSRGDIPWTEDSSAPLDFYRCYFKQEQDGMEIDNQFAVGDLVRCQTFNIKSGTSNNVKNRYYWRRCVYVGKDFIELSASNADKNSDAPQAGDEMVQLGNDSDKTRQSAIILSSYGDDAPSLKTYQGINSYSLIGKEVFCASRKELFALADKFQFVTRNANGEIESTQSFAELVMSVDGLRTTVANNKSDVDGQISSVRSQITQTADKVTTLTQQQTAMESKVSKIEQSTEKISLQVETTTNMKNCIVGSALRPWDDITKITAGLSQKVEIISGGGIGGSNYAAFSASGATANTWTGLYFRDIRVAPGKKYIFSIWVKVTKATDNGSYYTIKRFDNGVEGAVIKSSNYSASVGEWTLYTYQLTVPSGCSRLSIETAVRKNGAINVCRPMIMEGTEYGGWSLSPYDKTEAGSLETNLKSTGIDIENGKITATADKFEIRNNAGQITAKVNKDGLFETNNAIISGTIKAQRGMFGGVIKKSKTVVTPENFLYYFQRVNDGLIYYNMKWDRLSMFFELKGDFSKFMDDGSDAIAIMFPGIRPEGSYSIEEIEEARSFVGASVCICNSSSTDFGITGDTGHLYDGKLAFVSPSLFSGGIISLTCVAAQGDNAAETIGWTFVVCHQHTASK